MLNPQPVTKRHTDNLLHGLSDITHNLLTTASFTFNVNNWVQHYECPRGKTVPHYPQSEWLWPLFFMTVPCLSAWLFWTALNTLVFRLDWTTCCTTLFVPRIWKILFLACCFSEDIRVGKSTVEERRLTIRRHEKESCDVHMWFWRKQTNNTCGSDKKLLKTL